jgi:hypothetical protein
VSHGDSGPAALARLRDAIQGEDGPLADSLLRPPTTGREAFGAFGPLAAAGERAGANPQEYELLVESIFEGYLLHYCARGRVVAPDDPDLRLLGGDYLYAFGLARLARLGDLDAVAELADLISLCAQAHAGAEAHPKADPKADPPWKLCAAIWALSSLAVGAGPWDEQLEAKRLLRAGAVSETEVRSIADRKARELGLGSRLEHALIAFDRSVESPLSTT